MDKEASDRIHAKSQAQIHVGEGQLGQRNRIRESGCLDHDPVFSPLVCADHWPGGRPETRLVLIGKGLDRKLISGKFEFCVSADRPVFDRALGAI